MEDKINELWREIHNLKQTQFHNIRETERLDCCQRAHQDKITSHDVSIGKLEVKAGFWGILGGAIAAIVLFIVAWVKSILGK